MVDSENEPVLVAHLPGTGSSSLPIKQIATTDSTVAGQVVVDTGQVKSNKGEDKNNSLQKN
jgi:hypothetical protein